MSKRHQMLRSNHHIFDDAKCVRPPNHLSLISSTMIGWSKNYKKIEEKEYMIKK